MTILTDTELRLLDNYIVSNNFTEFTEAHFFCALADIVPNWRLEELAGQARMYDLVETEAYINYINNLMKENK